MNKNVNLKFGEILNEEGETPQLEVKFDIQDGDGLITDDRTLYLAPFRGYSFQVSGFNGNGDYGSTRVVGLGNIVEALDNYVQPGINYSIWFSNLSYEKGSVTKAVFNSMMIEALVKMCNSKDMNVGDLLDWNGIQKLREFAEIVYNYIKAKAVASKHKEDEKQLEVAVAAE